MNWHAVLDPHLTPRLAIWVTAPHHRAVINFAGTSANLSVANPLPSAMSDSYRAVNFQVQSSLLDPLPLLAGVPFTPPFTLKPCASLVS